MSDCHSWLGSARSKRRGGCSRGPVAALASGISPCSCRMRRTSVSEIPSPSSRPSSSRIRLVPKRGCSPLTATTASRRIACAGVSAPARRPGDSGTSASTPPSR